jgi:hypothetical protein
MSSIFDSEAWKTFLEGLITVLEWLHLHKIARLLARKGRARRKPLSVQEALLRIPGLFKLHVRELTLDITAYGRTKNRLHLDGKSVFGPKMCAHRDVWDTLGMTKDQVRGVLGKTFCRARSAVDAAPILRPMTVDTIACAAAIDFLTLLATFLREHWQERNDLPIECLEALQVPTRIAEAMEHYPELAADLRGYCAHVQAGKPDAKECRAVRGVLRHLRDLALPRPAAKDIEESVVADTRQFIKAHLLHGKRGVRRSKALAELACLHLQITLLVRVQEYVLA